LLLSEHKHRDNAATNLNSKNTKSRKLARLQGGVGTGAKEDESSTGHVWACWISPCYGARFETYEPFISLNFQIFFGPR